MHQPFKKLKELPLQQETRYNGQEHPEKNSGVLNNSKEEDISERPQDDRALFLSAMSDVKPLKKKGREIAPPPPPKERPRKNEEDAVATLQKIVDGEINFDLSLSEEHIQGYVHGLDPKIFHRLKKGQFSIEGNLDLHGMNADQAQFSLLTFIRDHYLNGSRCLLIIPGRGKGSPQKMGILKKELQSWLTRDPLKRVVLAFCTSLPKHGGAGAVYVLLRKYKKNRGKIIWDKYLLDLEPQ